MPTNNPTLGNELQFKPTKPMDNGEYTDPGLTFDLFKETLFLKNPTYGKDFQLKPTKPMDNGEYTDSGLTFDLIDEISLLKYKNPTSTDIDTLYSTVAPADINSQFTKKTDTISDGKPVYATGIYEQKDVTKLKLYNPTNPEGAVNKTFKGLSDAGTIQSQFFPKYFGTGVDSVDMELKTISTNLKNNLIAKSKTLSYISNLGNLPKNSSNSTNIVIDKELDPTNKWGKAAALVGLNLNGTGTSQYSTLGLSQLHADIELSDFRARKRSFTQQLLDTDLDKIKLPATSTLLLKHGESSDNRNGFYYAAYANDKNGVYAKFNLRDTYGFGDQGMPGRSARQDFTRISNIHDEGDSKYAFRGDIVTAQPPQKGNGTYDDATMYTAYRDLIKFFFTGPNLQKNTGEGDVMIFRAIINSLTDSHNPSWTPQQIIGRADPNYHYTGYSREVSLDFTVYASDRDEMKPIWQKLNMLAGYTAPIYDASSPAPIGPWMRITIGDLFVQQPAVINSLSYTLHESDTTWEINIEEDEWMNQLPHKVNVSIGFNLITDNLPEQGGRFYTLNKGTSADWLG